MNPPARLRIRMLGEFSVERNGGDLALPASKQARALLAYLALTCRPHRRDRLCELIWETPDDPRAALRWALTKLRPVVNDEEQERLVADRERVQLDCRGLDIDLRRHAEHLRDTTLSVESLDAMSRVLDETLLDGVDLPDQPRFQDWLVAERKETESLRGRTLGRLAEHPDLPSDRRLRTARQWTELEPFDPRAATLLVSRLEQFGRTAEAEATVQDYERRFRNAGVAWSADARIGLREPSMGLGRPSAQSDMPPTARDFQARQKIRFCTASDDVRIAYSTVGEGTPVVKAANWLSHLELDWDAPIWSPLLRELGQDHRIVRYDERGNGLSDWEVEDLSFEAFVNDLETVVDTVGLDRFALLGISQGAAVSIAYAVRHPERVSRLILFGGYPAGWRIDATDAEIREREAVMTLTATGWGRSNPAYRQIFSSTFMPSATPEELNWFNEFQRQTTSAENAVRFLSAFGSIDVRDLLPKLRAPTLVIHSLGDRRIPVEVGRNLAASIPDAEFFGLESENHLLLGREPASRQFTQAVRDFIRRG